MIRRIVVVSVAVCMLTDLAAAGQDVVEKTNWTGFREQVTQRKLKNRTVWISLATGGEIKANFVRVEENGLVVGSNRETKQWASGDREATVPRGAIFSVRFGGTVGKGGWIGGLAGLGAGAAVAGIGAAGSTSEGSAGGVVLLLIPLGAVGGYLIGRTTKRPA